MTHHPAAVTLIDLPKTDIASHTPTHSWRVDPPFPPARSAVKKKKEKKKEFRDTRQDRPRELPVLERPSSEEDLI